jgi:hypothetical protein
MLANKFWSWLAAVVAVFGFAATASAEFGPLFIEPDYFDPDLQFFAPADIDYFGDPAEATTGWFFTYDRMYVAVSRPDNGPRPWDLDQTWGNRFDIGYMTEENGGWLFSTTHIDGPTGEAASAKASLSSFELNKVFRLEPTFHNGHIEPFLGVRIVKFTDYGVPPIPLGDTIENNMVMGQLGIRGWKNIGRWKVSTDIRSFNGVNFQWYTTEDFDTFVPAGEVRAEAQYNFTRDIALRVGYEFLYFGEGIARNNNLFNNKEELTIHGVTFGFTINR